ncbi:type I-E CRISPR-associated protein Cse2/CasB [Halothiobacillus diazotrophicus]|uniref:Type I-E CRISPR-associated protein Cse2/CasB n=1 Tax=Halothiobacillus diazotrophicus TaxID=1860122 RepID=A0A191ZHK4_9GAMM|nr:type I-E CRISPR-associated protein Cse2/CasB [Halothiobacillus diazotrophicus]ANJ67345.1 type I-E CRISPR-associated protein Cse2/CasB [Halothiobacillus diazotrophicus]
MSEYIAWLEDMNARDTKVRAVLRRSLAFDPGTHIPAFPYVEPFLKGEAEGWRRQMHYLVAGLWAAHWREGRAGVLTPLAKACALHQLASGSVSTERRFIHLLDADREQLPHRLRQMIALLNEQPIDFQALLNDLLYWNRPDKNVQNAWARAFYRTITPTENIDADTETAA